MRDGPHGRADTQGSPRATALQGGGALADELDSRATDRPPVPPAPFTQTAPLSGPHPGSLMRNLWGAREARTNGKSPDR